MAMSLIVRTDCSSTTAARRAGKVGVKVCVRFVEACCDEMW